MQEQHWHARANAPCSFDLRLAFFGAPHVEIREAAAMPNKAVHPVLGIPSPYLTRSRPITKRCIKRMPN